MGKNVKLISTRGIVATILTLCMVYIFVTNTTEHITEYITLYMVVINYLFGRDTDHGDNIK